MITINDIGSYLAKHDVKPSYQRIQVFDYLYKKKNHPTVDMIYKELAPDMPTLSKTTIYNTLKLFIDKGIALMLNIEDKETRYDADTSIHGHAKCEKCDDIFDFDVNISAYNMKKIKNFRVNETHIYLKGICKNC